MTAIVAGQGLGLLNTSLGLLGGQGQLGVAGQGRSGEKVVVNAATGNLVIQQQDEWLVGVGTDLVAQRTYNSLAAGSDDDNGDNWRLGYSRRVEGINGNPTVTRVAEDGGLQTFTQVSPNTYQCKQGSGSYDTLVWNGSTWTWTDGDTQTKEVYQVQYGSTNYLLTSITDLDGLSVTLSYDATTRLITQIKDSNNEYIKVEYDTTTKKNITSLSTYTSGGAQITLAKRVSYKYDTSNRLQRVIVDLTLDNAGDAQTYVTEYSYDGSSTRVKTLKQGTLAQLDGGQYNSQLSFEYQDVGGSMRIRKVNESVNGQTLTTQFTYDTVAGTTTITDAFSKDTVLTYDVSQASAGTPKENTLLSIKQPVVNGADLITRFTYDANGNVETVTDASGNQTTYGYDANGNRTYERDGRGNVVERTFGTTGATANKLLTQTTYTTPDPDGAGSALPSGALTSRYVYDATTGHLRFAITPLGNVTEYVYFTGGNGKGQLQYSRQYANTYSLGSMDKAVTPSLTNMTDWVASSAVDKTRQTLVEYAYDFRGQLSKQIAYNKTNSSGAGLTDDNLQVVTQYVYDQAGNLLKKIDSRADEALTRDTTWARQVRKDLGIVDSNSDGKTVNLLTPQDKDKIAQNAAYTTTYTYDGLNRIIKQTDAQVDGQKGTITTVSVYDDTVRSTAVYKTGSSDVNSKLIELATSVSTYDEAGHLLSLAYTDNKSQQAMGTTKYTYDKLNRLISVEVPATLPGGVGEKSYYLYDDASRKIGEVNAEGALIEYRYNKNGQVSRTIAYDTLVNMGDTILTGKLAGGTAKLSDLGVDLDGLDKNTWYVYDKAGRQLFTLSSANSSTGDDAEVLRVREYTYDGLGRLVGDIAHLNPVSGSKFNQLKAFTGELSYDFSTKRIYMGSAYITVSTIADDRVTRYYYDADSRRIGELDAQNYYTQNDYDARGRLIARTRYATPVASVPSNGTLPTVVTAEAAYTALGQDQVSKYVYNNKGQLIGQLERAPIYNSANVYTGLGYLYTAYEYDGAGNRTKETRYETVQANTFDGTTIPVTSANDRVTTYTYDANNRLLTANTAPSGHKVSYAYDAAGRLTSTTTTVHRGDGGSDDVRMRQQRFDALGRLTGELSAEGAKALVGVSGEANIQAIWDKYATKYVYDDAGRRIAMIEPNGKDDSGNQTVYYYDKVGRVTHTVNALGEVTQYQYDAFGQKTQVIQYSNRAGKLKVSTSGLNSQFTAPGGSASTQTNYAYTRAGELGSVFKYGQSGSPADYQAYYYDALGNLIEMDTALSATKALWTLYGYDKRGLRTSTEEQLHTTTTTDGGITFTETTDSLRLTQNTFDAFGRAVTDTDGRGILTETNYDTIGRVVQLKVPSGAGSATTTYTYDAFGRTLSSKDRSGLFTRYVYDDVAGEITVQTPESGLKYTSVNSAGQTVSSTDARGNKVTYSYDKDGRLTETRVLDTDGSTVLSSTKTRYDMAGRVKETEDSRGTITSLTYDKAGRVLSRTVDSASGGLALTTLYRYDAKGQMVWTRDANGTWTKTSYSKKGDVLTVVTDPAKIPSGTVAANEDKTGDDLSQDANLIDNPASGGALALETAYTYNAQGKTLTVTQRKSGDVAALLKTNYTYDALGRRDSETVDPGGKNLTTTYEYDKNNRVTKKTDAKQQVTRYVYDEEGRQRFVVDGNGALTQYTYDINGRLSQTCRFAALVVGAAAMSDAQIADAATANANPSADQVTTNIYDKMGRLKYARDALGNLTQYDYDFNGNVIKTTRYGKQASPAPTVDTAKSVGLLKTYTIALGTLADATQDQVTRNYYDAANRRIWTLQTDYDKAGLQNLVYASHNAYDGVGNVIEQKQYAGVVQTRSATVSALGSNEVAITGTGLNKDDLYVVADSANDRTTLMAYDKANRLKFVIDGERYVTQNDYDSLGNLKSRTRYAAVATFGSGFTAGNEVTVLDVGAATTDLRCWVFRDQTGDVNRDRVDNYGYDNAGRLQTQSTTYRNGATVSASKKVYDAAGHVTDVINAYGTGQDVTTHYNYDTAGRLIEEIKAQGTPAQATTRYTLDNLGQREGIIDPRGIEAAESNSDWAQTTRAALLAAGKISSSALPVKDGADYKAILKAYTTTQVFDAQGHVTQIADPLGGTTNTDYDAFGNAIRIKDPNGNYGYFVFNQNNQSVWAIDPMGYATRTEYDALGQVSKITKYAKALQTPSSVFTSDAAGNKRTAEPTSPNLQLDAANDATTQIEHDLLGRQTKITDAENNPESMKYDALGNKTSYTNKLGGEYKYTYDRVGNLRTETLPERVKKYDTNGGVLSSDNLVINQYSYDARGNRTKAIEALGLQEERTTTYTYDALDRQVSKASQAMDIYTTDRSALVTDTPLALTIADGTVTRLAGTSDGWTNASFRSATGYAGGASISFKVATSGQFFIGLSTKANPTSYGDLDWCFHGRYGGADAYQKGGASIPGTHFDYSSNDTLTIAYDGEKIRFLINGTTEIYSQTFKTNQPLYMGGFLYNASLSLNKVEFGATTTVNGVSTNKVTPTELNRYDARGNLIEHIGADGARTLNYYDALNRKIADISPTGTLSTYTYSNGGDLLSMTVYSQTVKQPYPVGATLPSDTLPANDTAARTTFYGYDRVGRQISTAIKNIEIGEISSVTGNYEVRTQDLVTKKAYNANGNLVSETDARGNTTWRYYDLAGNQIAQVDAERYLTVWTYDASGHVKTQKAYANKLPDGMLVDAKTLPSKLETAVSQGDVREIDYTYDKMGRVKTQVIKNAEAKKLTAAGAIADADSPDATTAFDYNAMGQLRQRTEATGEVLNWEYDHQGREIESLGAAFTNYVGTANVRQTIDSEYNGLGLKTRSIELNKDSDALGYRYDHVRYYVYDNGGRLIREGKTTRRSTSTIRLKSALSNEAVEVWDPSIIGMNGLAYRQIDLAFRVSATQVSSGYTNGLSLMLTSDQLNRRVSQSAFGLSNTDGVAFAIDPRANKCAAVVGAADPTATVAASNPVAGVNMLDAQQVQVQVVIRGTALTPKQTWAITLRMKDSAGTAFKDVATVNCSEADFKDLSSVKLGFGAGASDTPNWVDNIDIIKDDLFLEPPLSETRYQYDAAGRISVKKLSRQTADSLNPARLTSTDPKAVTDITVYTYDLSGHQTKQQLYSVSGYDATLPTEPNVLQMVQTIEVGYDTFGEVVGKSTYGARYYLSSPSPYSFTGVSVWDKPTEWQEKTSYDAAGRAIKSNAGTGVTKGYVFDANGNATLSIEPSGVDLKGMTIDDMLARSDTHLTASRFDRRNQLVETIQPKLANVTDLSAPAPLKSTSQVFAGDVVVTVGSNTNASPQAPLSSTNTIAPLKIGPLGSATVSLTNNGNAWSVNSSYDSSAAELGDGQIVFGVTYECVLGRVVSSDDNGTVYAPTSTVYSSTYREATATNAERSKTFGSITTLVGAGSATELPMPTGQWSSWYMRAKVTMTKKTAYGDVALGTFSVMSDVVAAAYNYDTGGYNYKYPATYDPWSYDSPVALPAVKTVSGKIANQLLLMNVLAPNSRNVILMYRSSGSAWSYLRPANGATTNGAQAYYCFDTASLPSATYEFRCLATDAAGNVVDAQAGTLNLSSNPPAVTPSSVGGALLRSSTVGKPFAMLDNNGLINITHAGIGAKSATVKVRAAAASGTPAQDWSLVAAKSLNKGIFGSTNAAEGFSFNPKTLFGLGVDGKTYEYLITYLDQYSAPITNALGNFKVDDGASVENNSPIVTANLPTTVHFQNLSTAGKTVRLSYRSTAPGSTWQRGVVVNSVTGGLDWDAMSAAPDKTQAYSLDFELQVFDEGGLLVNSLSGTVTVGATRTVNTVYNQMPTNNVQVFNPGLPQAAAMLLHYRPIGSDTAYTVTTEINQPRISGDSPTFTLRGILGLAQYYGLMPADGGCDFEYYYEVQDSNYKTLAGGGGWPPSPARFHVENNSLVPQNPGTVVVGFADTARVKRTSQSRNAFGEVISQTDANGNMTGFAYNKLGKLTRKSDALVYATDEHGLQTDTKQSFSTTFYYDAQGRQIGTKDANDRYNTQSWVAEGVDGQAKQGKTFAADGGWTIASYDSLGDLRTSTQLMDSVPVKGDITATTRYEYDGDHRLVLSIQPKETSYLVTPLNAAMDWYVYDAAGNRIVHTTSADGIKPLSDKTYFDALGRVIKISSPGKHDTLTSYSWTGNYLAGTAGTVGGWGKTTVSAIKDSDFTNAGVAKPSVLPNTVTDWTDVFGRQIQHIDLGGRVFNYSYNAAGLLTSQQCDSTGQNIKYTYYDDGKLQSIVDGKMGSQTIYGYDANGNKTYEGYAGLVNGAWNMCQQSNVTYDALNRITEVNDPNNIVKYEYDKVGNIRRMTAYPGVGLASQDYWYTYDEMNRIKLTMGALVDSTKGGAVVAPDAVRSTVTAATASNFSISLGALDKANAAVSISYDKRGQRQTAKFGTDGRTEEYEFTARGYLMRVWITNAPSSTMPSPLRWIASERLFDLGGRVLQQKENKLSATQTAYQEKNTQKYIYDDDGKVVNSYIYDRDKITTTRTVNTIAGDGTLLKSDVSVNGTASTTTKYTYEWWDSAQQQKIEQTSGTTGSSVFTYDVNGHIKSVLDVASGITMTYATNAQGLILRRNEDGGGIAKYQNFYYFNGQRIGDSGNAGGSTRIDYAQYLNTVSQSVSKKDSWKTISPITANYAQSYQAISGNYPGFSATRYVVPADMKLEDIAQSVWGDSTLWYLIAEANGLSAGVTVAAGQSLIIPNKVTNVHNNSLTRTIYDPSDAMGDTSPTLPDPPPPPEEDDGCGAVGSIIMVAVAVAVAIATAGAAAALGPVLAGALGGAAGSIASQAVGMAMGNVKEFSWSSVASAAVTGAVGGAINGVGPMDSASHVTGPWEKAFTFGEGGVSGFGSTVVRSLATNVVSQGALMATGLQEKFSWTSVAAAGASSALTWGLGSTKAFQSIGGQNPVGKVLQGTLGGMAGGWASAMMRHDRPDWGGIAANSFGSALGDAVVGSIVGGDQKKAPQKQEPGYQSKPLTQADINGFLEGLDDPSLAPVARDGVNFKALKDAARAAAGMGPTPGALNELGGGLNGIDIPLSSTPGQVAQNGDSWAKLARQQYGDERYALALAQANGATSTLLRSGDTVYFPDLSGADLKQGGQLIAADTQARAQRQAAAAQQASAANQSTEPVWSFKEASMAQRKLDDAQALVQAQSRFATGGSPGAYMSASPGNTYEQTRLNLGAALALPVLAAPVAGYVGGSTLATLGRVYSTVGPAGTASLGFVTGGGMDAGGQLWQNGTWRWEQSAFAGVVGAVSGPIGATSGLTTNVVLGSTGSVLNTAFNNYYYKENNDLLLPAVLGGGFGVAGYYAGSMTTKGLGYVLPEISYPNLNRQIPVLFQAPKVSVVPGVAGVTAGGVTSGIASFVPIPAPGNK